MANVGIASKQGKVVLNGIAKIFKGMKKFKCISKS